MTIHTKGKGNISARIIQDSINSEHRIVTFELEYPRFIHSELMTHRVFSRNAASSRAIPVAKMHENIRTNPATPVWWGKNQPGMQAKEEVHDIESAKMLWQSAIDVSLNSAQQLLDVGLHKQIANRVTEFGQMMKTIVTSTEWDNWFQLRDHEDAQPEIRELAQCMKDAMTIHYPMPIAYKEWHVPYVERHVDNHGKLRYVSDGKEISKEDAIVISASCCAQVSYRNNDTSLEKARDIFDRLINSKPQHASPIEHQATPMKITKMIFDNHPERWEDGITHVARNRDFFSGNFRGWLQYRQLIA